MLRALNRENHKTKKMSQVCHTSVIQWWNNLDPELSPETFVQMETLQL